MVLGLEDRQAIVRRVTEIKEREAEEIKGIRRRR